MPMSNDFKERLEGKLSKIIDRFGTPFHILDEMGIRNTCDHLNKAFSITGNMKNWRNFFAVKACPRLAAMKIVQEMGMGFDCSSIPELRMAREIGAKPEDIMFTSNNTSEAEYKEALANGGCILNLDDSSFVKKVPNMPELICFRYNPGPRRSGTNLIIGNPIEQKYGTPHEQLINAYRLAINAGSRRFGLHTMIASNTLEEDYIAETARMLMEIAVILKKELGIELEFINIGGGVGIPYRPEDKEFDVINLAWKINQIIRGFSESLGYVPRIVSEMGRYITGSHGVLVTTCINKMHKYLTFVGVDACMSANPRPAMYSTPESECYHHISVVGKNQESDVEIVSVIGSLCENNDQFARQRVLPVINEGDVLIMHDTGAHALAMGSQYNARLRPKELMLYSDGSVGLINSAETCEDYLRTQRKAMEIKQILTF